MSSISDVSEELSSDVLLYRLNIPLKDILLSSVNRLPPVINVSDGTISAIRRTHINSTNGFFNVSHLRKLYNIKHNAMEINLNIQRYWLPGRRLNTGYIAVVVHTRMTTAVTNPALDFLYPRNIPHTAIMHAAIP